MSKEYFAIEGPFKGSRSDVPSSLGNVPVRLRCLTVPGGRCLKFWRGEICRWNGRRYEKVSEKELRAEVTGAIQKEFARLAAAADSASDDDEPKPQRKVTRSLVSNVIQSLEAITLVPDAFEAPIGWTAPKRCQLARNSRWSTNWLFSRVSSLVGSTC